MANAAEYFGNVPYGAGLASTVPVDVGSGSLITVATLSSGGPYYIEEIWFSNLSGFNRFVNEIEITVDGAAARDVFLQNTADDFPLNSPVAQLPYKLRIPCNTITVRARASGGTNIVAWLVYSPLNFKNTIPSGDKVRFVTPASVGGGTLTSIAGSITTGAPFIIDALYLGNGNANKVIRQIEVTVDGTARDLFNDAVSGEYTLAPRELTRYDINKFASTSFDIKVLTEAAGGSMMGWFTYKVM